MQAMGAQQSAAGAGRLSHRTKILLIDEDSRDRDHYRRMLQDSGFDVKTCGHFERGVQLINEGEYECVIVSQGGPDFQGRVVLERSVARDRSRPVVVLSRYHDVGCYLEAMQLGAVDYLEKPLSAIEIVRAVTTHIRPHHAAA